MVYLILKMNTMDSKKVKGDEAPFRFPTSRDSPFRAKIESVHDVVGGCVPDGMYGLVVAGWVQLKDRTADLKT